MDEQTRRDFLKIIGAAGLGGSFSSLLNGCSHLESSLISHPARRPNVVFIFTDDQGSVDVNCYGAKDLYTPNMDRLARQGVRFTQFYVRAPICSPSRASLLTGRTPQHAGLTDNAKSDKGLPSQELTIAEVLKPLGYRTACIGKWHLGAGPGTRPNDQGFDEFFGHLSGCIDNYSHFAHWKKPTHHDLWENDKEIWAEGSFFPDLVAQKACRFIQRNRRNPFFLYLAFNMPHYPLQARAKYRRMYAHLEEPRKSYAAFLSNLDEKIGQVVGTIDRLGLRKDTLIVLLSDNGHSTEARNNYGGGSAGPYRGFKSSLWEGGIRLPCIVSWPGHIPQNEVRDQVAASTDWLPTIAAYCSAALPPGLLDGLDIRSVIASSQASSPPRILHWQLYEQWAVRDGDWKLVVNPPLDPKTPGQLSDLVFLGNLAQDVSETHNFAREHPEIVDRLTKLHQDWVRLNNNSRP